MDPENGEQKELLVEEQCQDDEGVVETAVPAPVSSDEGGGGTEEMEEEAMDLRNEEQNMLVGEQSQGDKGDVPDMETAVPAPASLDEGRN